MRQPRVLQPDVVICELKGDTLIGLMLLDNVRGRLLADVILKLVDYDSYHRLTSMSVEQLIVGFESGNLRSKRPESNPHFHRGFDVDIEGDFLEWADKTNSTSLDTSSKLILADWASVAEWRCWDVRLFLYVEPLIDKEVQSVEDFLTSNVWDLFSSKINHMDRESYSESVIMDWMARRQELGETMDPDQDPRIIPTMESHRSLTHSLFNFMDLSLSDKLGLLIGREYLDPGRWIFDGKSIEVYNQ